MKLNGEKSNLLFISRNRGDDDEKYSLQLFDDNVRPVDSARFLGVEIDSRLSFKKHFESVGNRSSKKLNVLKVLARSGTEPSTLMKLYQCYISSLFENGCPSFISASKEQFSRFQRIQNDAIRTCLKLPSYIRTSLIHEYAGISTVKQQLCETSTKLLAKMRMHNEHIRKLVESQELPTSTCHISSLDILL